MVPPYSNSVSRAPPYLFVYLVPHISFRVQDYHLLWLSFPAYSTIIYAKLYQALPPSLAATKGISVDFFSYGYLDVSVPHVRPHIPAYISNHICGWVPPFRHLWINAHLPAPHSFSQAITSFIASDCQGIHRLRLFPWSFLYHKLLKIS